MTQWRYFLFCLATESDTVFVSCLVSLKLLLVTVFSCIAACPSYILLVGCARLEVWVCLQTCCRFENVSGKVDFMGHGFTSGGQEPWSVFSAAVCKIRAGKCYVESFTINAER